MTYFDHLCTHQFGAPRQFYDFMHPYGISLEYHDTMVKAKMFVGKQNECIALQRKIAPPAFKPNICTFATQTQPSANSPGSWKELKQLNHDISAGTQVAHRRHLLSKHETGNSPDMVGLDKLSPGIRKVLKKHSAEGGTLAATNATNMLPICYQYSYQYVGRASSPNMFNVATGVCI